MKTRKHGTKSAFVRAQPPTMSAKEVIKKGKAQGVKLSAAQVYTIRAHARKAAAKMAKQREAVSDLRAIATRMRPYRKAIRTFGRQVDKTTLASGTRGQQLRTLILERGIDAAQREIDAIRSSVDKLTLASVS